MIWRILICLFLCGSAVAQDFGDDPDEFGGPTWTPPEDDMDEVPPPPPPPPFPSANAPNLPPDSGAEAPPAPPPTSSPSRPSFELPRSFGRSGGAEGGVEFRYAKDPEGKVLTQPSKEERLKRLRESRLKKTSD